MSVFAIANPAAVYCNELGYNYTINKTIDGEQGICIFPDGNSCDEWQFLEGKCGTEYSYCKKHGYGIETATDGKNPYSSEYAVCSIPLSYGKFVTSSVVEKVSVTDLMNLTRTSNEETSLVNPKEEKVSNIKITSSIPIESSQSYWDWRNVNGSNWMTSVKNQNPWGTCWAFALIGTVEAKNKIVRNDPSFDTDLSEQDLVSCSQNALEFMKNGGVVDEPCFPYVTSKDSYSVPCSDKCSTGNKREWKIYSYGEVSSQNDADVKNYLINFGPLDSVLYMGPSYWDGDIYRCNESSPSYPPDVAHAVVLVGYNDTGQYWIFKNSWGSTWNGNGYFKLGYGECSINSFMKAYVNISLDSVKNIKSNSLQLAEGSVSGTLSNTFNKDSSYLTLSQSCFINCGGANLSFNFSTTNLTDINSIDLIANQKSSDGNFNMSQWDGISWNSLGSVPQSFNLLKYNICGSKLECSKYLSKNISINYYHQPCTLCFLGNSADFDWLYLEAIPEPYSGGYCSAYTGNGGLDYIQRVAVNENERKSGTTNYSDFTDVVLANLNSGKNYTLYVDGYSIEGQPPRKEYVKAWIDFNNDKTFSSNEEIDFGSATFSGIHIFSKNFTVPTNASLSEIRMRVYLKYNTPPSSCEASDYGEVEDYKLRIINDTSPPYIWTPGYGAGYVWAGSYVTIKAYAYDESNVSSVYAKIESPDENVTATIQLFDDGLHNDGNPKDGLYGNYWMTDSTPKDYYVDFVATDVYGNNATYDNLDKFTTIPFSYKSKVLLIDDDSFSTYIKYYKDALNSTGITYDVWNPQLRGDIDNFTIGLFKLCIWPSPYGAPSSTQLSTLAYFLDNGGNLFISGQDVGYNLNFSEQTTNFYNNYLHAKYIQDNTGVYFLRGASNDTIANGINITISGGDGASNQYWPDEIEAINGSIPIFTYTITPIPPPPPPPITSSAPEYVKSKETVQGASVQSIQMNGTGALRVDTGTYKVVYFAFGFEAINNSADRNLLMKRVTDWLIDLKSPEVHITSDKYLINNTGQQPPFNVNVSTSDENLYYTGLYNIRNLGNESNTLYSVMYDSPYTNLSCQFNFSYPWNATYYTLGNDYVTVSEASYLVIGNLMYVQGFFKKNSTYEEPAYAYFDSKNRTLELASGYYSSIIFISERMFNIFQNDPWNYIPKNVTYDQYKANFIVESGISKLKGTLLYFYNGSISNNSSEVTFTGTPENNYNVKLDEKFAPDGFYTIIAFASDKTGNTHQSNITLQINTTPICTDNDKDGYYAEGGVCGPKDCNDNNLSVHPGATEICNGIDDDCNGVTDNITQSCGSGSCAGTQTCNVGVWGNCSSSGNSCDDGLYCNVGETCNNLGVCSGGTTRDCSYLADQCNSGVCNEILDKCEKNSTLKEGLTCNDGLYCTMNDACKSGGCFGSPRDCSDAYSCTDDSCDETNDLCLNTINDTKCSSPEVCRPLFFSPPTGCGLMTSCTGKPNGTTCDDGIYCNGPDQCQNGNCVNIGPSIDCSANNLLEIATCNNNPDNNPFTWDYAQSFTSVCDENSKSCTTGTQTLTNTCSVANCGAECDSTNSCNDKCIGNIRYYSGNCLSTCNCSYSTENCDLKDDWYNTTNTQWINITKCSKKEQVQQEFRNYSCSPTVNCNYTINDTRWIDTGNKNDSCTLYHENIDSIENQTTEIDSKNETNTTLEISTVSNVTNASVDLIKYYDNPKSSIFGVVELNKFIEIIASPELEGNLSWVIIKIYYSHDELKGIDENSLRIYYYNQTSDTWTPFNPPDGGVNTTENYIWANSTHFSYYGSGGLLLDGQACSSNSECSSGYCVHNVCRASSIYCGDTFCDSGETCSSCSGDCETCYSPPPSGGGFVPPTTTQPTPNVSQLIPAQKTCTEDWSCTDWSVCTSNVTTRTCTDKNSCGTTVSKPVESKSCLPETAHTGAVTNVAPTGLFLGLQSTELIVAVIVGVVVAIVIIYGVLKVKRRRKKLENILKS